MKDPAGQLVAALHDILREHGDGSWVRQRIRDALTAYREATEPDPWEVRR